MAKHYLPILIYHRILQEEPTRHADPYRIAVHWRQFRSHMAWLHRCHYHTVNLDHYAAALKQCHRWPRRSFAITFDDGYEEIMTLALPILQEFGFTATVFAVPGCTVNEWDKGQARLLGPDALRAWRRAGMSVGAHTIHHVHLPNVPPMKAREEIVMSKQMLEDILKEPVSIFAYPYGETTDSIEGFVRDAGYKAAFATDRAPQDHSENPFRIRRVGVFPNNTPAEILWKVMPFYPAYQDWKRRS